METLQYTYSGHEPVFGRERNVKTGSQPWMRMRPVASERKDSKERVIY